MGQRIVVKNTIRLVLALLLVCALGVVVAYVDSTSQEDPHQQTAKQQNLLSIRGVRSTVYSGGSAECSVVIENLTIPRQAQSFSLTPISAEFDAVAHGVELTFYSEAKDSAVGHLFKKTGDIVLDIILNQEDAEKFSIKKIFFYDVTLELKDKSESVFLVDAERMVLNQKNGHCRISGCSILLPETKTPAHYPLIIWDDGHKSFFLPSGKAVGPLNQAAEQGRS